MAEIKVSPKVIRVYYLIQELEDIMVRLLQSDNIILPTPLVSLKTEIEAVITNQPNACVYSVSSACTALEIVISGLKDTSKVLKSPEPNKRSVIISANNLLSACKELEEPPLVGGLTAQDTEFVAWCSVKNIYGSIFEKWHTCRRFDIFLPEESLQGRFPATYQRLSAINKNLLKNSSIPGFVFDAFRVDVSVPYVSTHPAFIRMCNRFMSLTSLYAPEGLFERHICSRAEFYISDCMEAYADLGKVLAALEHYYFLVYKVYGGD